MEPEHVIDETATIQGADIEKVYDDCVEWLKESHWGNPVTRLIETRRSSYLLANQHTSVVYLPDDPRSYKQIEISLNDDVSGVNLRIVMSPQKNLSPDKKLESRILWLKDVEKLWERIGVIVDDELLRGLYSVSDLKLLHSENRVKTNAIHLIVILFLMLSMVFSGLSVITGFFITIEMVLVMVLYSNEINFKKRLKILHSDI